MSPSPQARPLEPPNPQNPSEAGTGPVGPSAAGSSNPGELQVLGFVREIVANARRLAQAVPQAADLVRQINDLAQKVQVRIIQGHKPPEPGAPPVA